MTTTFIHARFIGAALSMIILASAVSAQPRQRRRIPQQHSGQRRPVSNAWIVAAGNTAFALDLYAKLKDESGNLFFSPYSLSTALAMTAVGARENTEKQMTQTLHLTLDRMRLHPAFAGLQKQLNAVQAKGNIQLHVANALWIEKDATLLKAFLDVTSAHYSAAPHAVDFKTAAEAARKQINAWVEEKTKNKIKDLLKPGAVDAMTRLVLTNAIYFKGHWARQFKKSATRDMPFKSGPEKTIQAPLMTQKERFGYSETDKLQVLEMPYVGKDLSMIVLLPRKADGLADVENALNPKNLKAWTSRLWKKEVIVFLPKFKMTSEFDLGKTLAALGMPDAFSPAKADLSGISGKKDLHISAVVHKAFVDVNEEGTEAAAATGMVVGITAIPSPPPVFRADHPFVFLIRHNASGSILFMGRVTNPKEA